VTTKELSSSGPYLRFPGNQNYRHRDHHTVLASYSDYNFSSWAISTKLVKDWSHSFLELRGNPERPSTLNPPTGMQIVRNW